MTIGLAALAVVAVLVVLEVASGGGGGEKRPAPALPSEVLHPPKVTLAELRGHPALINFFASWCGPCQEEAPEVEALARSLRGRAALVGVDWSDDLDNARAFVREHGWTFPVLRDHGEVGDEYGISGLPATFVLDSKGMIVNTLRGPQTREDLEAALESVESEEEAEAPGGAPKSGDVTAGRLASAPVFQARVRYVRAAGTRIAWYERGSGPPLLMLTGTGSTMSEWDPALLRLLARDHRLILFDYPGVGLSGPWHGHRFDSLSAAAAALMGAIHVRRAAVLGWSMGGFVAQRLAIDHPGRVSSLILAGTNPGGPRAVLGTRRAQRVDSEPDPPLREILHELYPAGRQGEARRFLRRLELAGRDGEVPDDFHVAAATTRRQVAAEDFWLRSNGNYRRLARIRVPTLAAAGRRDPVVPPVNLRRIAAQIPGARFEMFAGAHAFLFQDRRRFARAVEALGR